MNCNSLPQKKVLFLGGHQNMTKKLQIMHPDWKFLSDEQFKRKCSMDIDFVFYWTGHGSHKLMQFAYSRIPETAQIIYVTATNLSRLEHEMLEGYSIILDNYRMAA